MSAFFISVSAILALAAQIGEGFYLPEGGMGRLPETLNHALAVRGVADALEEIVADEYWPLPSYQELLYLR